MFEDSSERLEKKQEQFIDAQMAFMEREMARYAPKAVAGDQTYIAGLLDVVKLKAAFAEIYCGDAGDIEPFGRFNSLLNRYLEMRIAWAIAQFEMWMEFSPEPTPETIEKFKSDFREKVKPISL